MSIQSKVSLDRVSDYFVNYLFERDKEVRQLHVRRVLPWLGLLLLAIDRVASDGFSRKHIRQVAFEYRGHLFKVRYNHQTTPRGGIEFVEYFPERGSPEGNVAVRVSNLKQAQSVYKGLRTKLDRFIDG
jgi:hypothetical protein